MLKHSVLDFQIDPKAIGTYFEFLIAARLCRIRLQEGFRDIAVPKFIAAPVKIGVIEDGDEAKVRDKFQVKKFGRPQQANFGLTIWIRIFPLPVGIEVDGLCASPCFGRRETGGIDRAMEMSGENRVLHCFGVRGEPFAHGLVFVS